MTHDELAEKANARATARQLEASTIERGLSRQVELLTNRARTPRRCRRSTT